MPRILISGGSGFLGSHLCDRFIAEGYEVICMDNFLTGRTVNVEQLQHRREFELVRWDVTKPPEIEGPLDYILHFASVASPKDYVEYPLETLLTGSVGTANLLEVAKDKGAVFLLASSSEVYGDPSENPQRESYWGNVNPIGMRSMYDEAKRFSEAYTMAVHRKQQVDVRIARIFNTYGPRMRPLDGRVLPNFVTQALRNEPLTVYGKGTQTRSFTYVLDLVDGIFRLLHSRETNPVNLGNPQETTILEFALEVIEETGSCSEIVFEPLPSDDPKVRRPDITRAREILGWNPTVQRIEGLRKTIPYFREAIASSLTV